MALIEAMRQVSNVQGSGRGDTYSFVIRLLTATSFSTPKSSKVWGVKASLRNVLPQIGQGAGPSVNNLSIHDSHLSRDNQRK